jgi:hypothetical protein
MISHRDKEVVGVFCAFFVTPFNGRDNANRTTFAVIPTLPLTGLKKEVKGFSDLTDADFKRSRWQKKHLCHQEMFQLVLRRFTQPFKGDEFNIYRTLRSNHAYLFF